MTRTCVVSVPCLCATSEWTVKGRHADHLTASSTCIAGAVGCSVHVWACNGAPLRVKEFASSVQAAAVVGEWVIVAADGAVRARDVATGAR